MGEVGQEVAEAVEMCSLTTKDPMTSELTSTRVTVVARDAETDGRDGEGEACFDIETMPHFPYPTSNPITLLLSDTVATEYDNPSQDACSQTTSPHLM